MNGARAVEHLRGSFLSFRLLTCGIRCYRSHFTDFYNFFVFKPTHAPFEQLAGAAYSVTASS